MLSHFQSCCKEAFTCDCARSLSVHFVPEDLEVGRFLYELTVQVRVVASLPCYSSKNVNEQRGGGVFERSIRGLQLLNEAGYGREESPLVLDLVYNPNGAFLAPSQSTLQVPTFLI